MMVDDSDWELAPENAHPTARAMMVQDFYWDCTDTNSPFGSDTGADVLAFFRERRRETSETPGMEFLSDLLAGWDVSDRDWEILDGEEIARLIESDEFSFSHRDDSILALAFAQLMYDGRVNSDIRERASTALTRQKSEAALNLWDANSRNERRSRLDVMQKVLQSAPLV